MKFYCFKVNEITTSDDRIFKKAFLLDYSNACICEVFVKDEDYEILQNSLSDHYLVDVTDKISLVFDKFKGFYKPIYKGEE